MAEPTSWTKPGRVSSAERAPPPTVSSASSTITERPLRASSTAAARPFGPEPTTTASYVPLPLSLTFPMLPCIALPACGTGHAGKELRSTILLPLLEPLGGPELGLSGAELVAPPSLKADIETGRPGDGHHGHYAALDRVAHHQVRGFGYAARHIQRKHDDALLAYLVDGPGNLSPHERTRQDKPHRPR